MHLLSAINELIFPSRCVACGALGLSICSRCRKGWNPHRYDSYLNISRHIKIPVISSVPYSPIAQKVILSAKESGIKSADALVANAITHSIKTFLADGWCDIFIPIPSRPRAVRKRGRQFVEDISLDASLKTGIPLYSILSHSRAIKDQSGLNAHERRNNLAGAFVVDIKQGAVGKALLIDDLITTGATLAEAARALSYAGIEVVGAVTAAVALAPRIASLA